MSPQCPIQAIIEVISKKWVLHIFHALTEGVDTFSGFQKEIEGINSRILSERLTELETHGLVERKIVCERPVKIKYLPTEKCFALVKEFEGIEEVIRSWG
jgi:DNA-binding HxlR family transcriptional regulator